MFRSVTQIETVHWLVRVLSALEPFAAITGDAGMGKSVVAAEAAAQLGARGCLAISVASPIAGPLELQATLARGLGISPGPQTTPAMIAAALRDRGFMEESWKPVVLLIDGAETLSPSVLQYLWLMHRLSGMGRPTLQTVFIGRFAFWERVAVPELAGLNDAIVARSVLPPLPDREALAYLRNQLSHAGAEAAPIPRGLAQEVVTLGKGVPGRIKLIADAVVACEPKRLRVTRKGVSAAEAALSGGSPATRAPVARRRGVRFLIAGAVAMAALAAGWSLLPQSNPRMPDRLASAAPPSLATAPAIRPRAPTVAATHPRMAKPSPPAPVAARAAALPAPPPLSAVAKAAPPIVVLPDAAMSRITVQYPEADPAVAAHARAVVAMLRARGLSVGDAAPVAAAARSTNVEYYFVEDRAEAARLARELGGAVSVGRINGGSPDLPPPPGTLRVTLSDRAAPGAIPMRASAPTSNSVSVPTSGDARSSSKEPP